MSRFFFAFAVLLSSELALVTVAEVLHFSSCRLPIHATFKNHYIMLNSYSSGDYVCMRFNNTRSLGGTAGQMLVPLKCVRQSDGTTQAKLAPEASEECEMQTIQKRACKLRTDLRLTGQSEAQGFDEVYITRGSYACVERFGREGETAPSTHIERCWTKGEMESPPLKMFTKQRNSCKDIRVMT